MHPSHSYVGRMRTFNASTIRSAVKSSIGTGSGPTPALTQAAPQKGWSPKKGTMNVGLPVGVHSLENVWVNKNNLVILLVRFIADRLLGEKSTHGYKNTHNSSTTLHLRMAIDDEGDIMQGGWGTPTTVQSAGSRARAAVMYNSTATLKQPIMGSLTGRE